MTEDLANRFEELEGYIRALTAINKEDMTPEERENQLKSLADSLIGAVFHHLFARRAELRTLYEEMASTRQLPTEFVEGMAQVEAVHRRVSPLSYQYRDLGEVISGRLQVPGGSAEERRYLRGTTSEPAEPHEETESAG